MIYKMLHMMSKTVNKTESSKGVGGLRFTAMLKNKPGTNLYPEILRWILYRLERGRTEEGQKEGVS